MANHLAQHADWPKKYGEVRLNIANQLALRATTTPDPAGGDDDPTTPSSEGQPR